VRAAGDLETTYRDVFTGEAIPLPDTPFNRAWLTASARFEDDAKRVSFQKRMEMMLPFTSGKYRSYVDYKAGSMHITLLATIASVPFSIRTTKKALRAAFDAEFKRQLARLVDPGDPESPS
jgi:hypothetical protein